MSTQNRPTERLDFVENVHDVSRIVFERVFSWFDHGDPLRVDGALSEVRLCYVSTNSSSSEHSTFIDCRFHFDVREMWIGSIQVAACRRLQGVGGQLVKAAEVTASVLGMEKVRIQPRWSSIDFWRKMNYVRDASSARVLWKNLTSVDGQLMNRRASWLGKRDAGTVLVQD